MDDREHLNFPAYDPGSSPPAAAPPTAAGKGSPEPARSPSDRRGYSRSVSRSRSPSRSRSRSIGRRKRGSHSPGRRSSPRRYTRPVCGNYGVAGGNPNPRMPVVDVLTRFPMTCLFWKTNSCVKGAEKCSYIHGFVCRNDLYCNRKGCSDVHIKSTRLSFQSGSRGYMKPGRGGYMRGGGRGGRGYGSYHGFGRDGGRDGRRGNYRDASYGASGGRYHGGRDGSRGRGGSYERRSSREAYRRDSTERRPPDEGERSRWSRDRPGSRTRNGSSSSSDRSRGRGRRTLSRSPKRRSHTKSSDRSSSSSGGSRSRSTSRHRSPNSEKKASHSNGVNTPKKTRKTTAASAVDPQKVANMFKDDMDLSQDTIDKLLEAVGEGSKKRQRSTSLEQCNKDPGFNDSNDSPYEAHNKSDRSGSPPMRPPPPPPPKVTASDLDSVIPPPYRALKVGGGKDMWTPMMDRPNYDSRPVEPGLSRWEIETPYLSRENEGAVGQPGLSPPPRNTPRPAPTAKGISSELDTLFSRTFDNSRYKDPASKNEKEKKSLEPKQSGDTFDCSDEEERERKFGPAQGTGEALSWLMRKRQGGAEADIDKTQAGRSSSRKRIHSESSESSSEGSEDDKADPDSPVKEDKSTKASLMQRKTSILKNMKMLMEQKTRLDAQKEELSRNHRGSDDVLQGILNENTLLNEEITKQIQNMCALVDEINKSLEDLDEVQGKSKSKKNKKKKTRKKHKKERRQRQSHLSDDEKISKYEKSSKSSKLEKEELDEEESSGHQSMQATGSPVVAPRYWDIVKPISVTDPETVQRSRSPSPMYDTREEYKKDYYRDRKEHEGREYDEYGPDKRRFVEKRERSYDHNRRGEYHGRGAANDDHEVGKYGRDYEMERRGPHQPRSYDNRHSKQEEAAKADGRYPRGSASPGVDRRGSRKFGGGMYADKLDGNPAESLAAGVKNSTDKGKAELSRQMKAQQKQDDEKTAASKEEMFKRITNMQSKHPEKVKKRCLSSEDKKPLDDAVEDESLPTTQDTKQESSSPFIDQGMHWCGLCNIFCDTLPQYLEHLLDDVHLLKLKQDDKSWFAVPPPEEMDIAAFTRPLQGVEFVHSISSFYCELCCLHLIDSETAATHMHAAKHVNAYKSHIQEKPLYESSFFKAKMNAYAKFMMGQNILSTTLAKTPTAEKKMGRAFLGERNDRDAVHSEGGAAKGAPGRFAGLHNFGDDAEDTKRQSNSKNIPTETGTPNHRSVAAHHTPRARERPSSSSHSRSHRDSVDETKSSGAGSRSPRRSGGQKSDGKVSSSRETSIRVVARSYGSQPKVEDTKPPVEKEPSVTDLPAEETEMDCSSQSMSESVDSFVNKLDENDKIIEELKKKVASRIQEKRQAQSQREEEEARNREEEEKEARKKLEAKFDKLAKPKAVVGQKKSQSRFPLFGKMPFFKSKPTKSMTSKGNDKGVVSKSKDASDAEQNKLNQLTPDLVLQDIQDPKFSKVPVKDDSNDSQDVLMFEEGSFEFESEDNSGESSLSAGKGSKHKIAVKSDVEQTPDMKVQLKRMLSMTKIKKDKIDSPRVPQVNEKLTKFTKEDCTGASTDMFEEAKSDGETKSVFSQGIIIPGEKISNTKQKHQKIPKTKKQKSTEETDIPSSTSRKHSNEKVKSTDKSDAIGPVLPLAIPLPVAVSVNSCTTPTSTIDLRKLPPGYPKFLGTSNSTPPSHFSSAKSFPPKTSVPDNPMSSSFSPSQMSTYGFPPSHMNPFTTTVGSGPPSGYPPFMNTSGSPMSGKSHDSLNTSSTISSVFEVGSGAAVSKAPIPSIPDFTTLFSQPPPMLLRTPPPDIGMHTSSPRVPPPPSGHQATPPPKREVTPPPPGTEIANSQQTTGGMVKTAGQGKSAFDAEEDLLPPGVEPDEVETPSVHQAIKTPSDYPPNFDANGHKAVTQMSIGPYSSFSVNSASLPSDQGKSKGLNETTDVDATNEILAHAIPTKAQIDSRLIAAGQLSPSALLEDDTT